MEGRKRIIWLNNGLRTKIARRLESSRSGRHYLFLPDPFGLNNSPYKPLFSVTSEKFYYLKILPPLKRELEAVWVGNIYVPYPRSREEEVLNFLKGFEKPHALYVGFRDFNEIITKKLGEVFIFDLSMSKTKDLYAERKSIADKLMKAEWSEPFELQGSLRGRFVKLDKLSDDSLKENLKFTLDCFQEITIFNHLMWLETSLPVLPLDNKRFIINFTDGMVGTTIYSYDHPTVEFHIHPGEILWVEHPFPSEEEAEGD